MKSADSTGSMRAGERGTRSLFTKPYYFDLKRLVEKITRRIPVPFGEFASLFWFKQAS